MKITWKSSRKKTDFVKVPIGSCFIYDDALFIRTYDNCGEKTNAVDLLTGMKVTFMDFEEKIVPVKAEIIVE